MGFKPDNKVDPTFNMSSMTDMIFLLLVFFMLTSNSTPPAGEAVNLPDTMVKPLKSVPKVHITMTKDGLYYIDGQKVNKQTLLGDLKYIARLPDAGQAGAVIINADKETDARKVVEVATLAASLNMEVSVAANTKDEE
ncbi:biopolymer transporter ExbD [Algivirga pacifica]|uniref:Biopolymer transporter ExbD n=1 Tax=Algivirga pacifica TaxID=1162670 RepID=A0ABP9DCA3_9BACT